MNVKRKILAAIALCAMAACAFADETSDALIQAAKTNNTAEVARLIAEGADVNAKTAGDMTALMYAVWYDAADAAKLLIQAGADVNNTTEYFGLTALMYAANDWMVDVAKLLIESGADVNARDKHGKTALMIAKEWGSTDVIEVLMVAGAKD